MIAGRKRMACTVQASPQARHTTFDLARQLLWICALSCQGGSPSRFSSARGWQDSTHLPQKVHSPRPKSTVGRASMSNTRMCCGQALMQSLQRVQAATKAASARAQGGRGTVLLPEKLPRRNWRRLMWAMPEV